MRRGKGDWVRGAHLGDKAQRAGLVGLEQDVVGLAAKGRRVF